MAGTRPLVLTLDRSDLDRLVVIATLRGPHVQPADIVRELVDDWLAGAGRAELAHAAERLAQPA